MPLRPPSRLPAVRQGVSFSMVCEMACRQAGSLPLDGMEMVPHVSNHTPQNGASASRTSSTSNTQSFCVAEMPTSSEF